MKITITFEDNTAAFDADWAGEVRLVLEQAADTLETFRLEPWTVRVDDGGESLHDSTTRAVGTVKVEVEP